MVWEKELTDKSGMNLKPLIVRRVTVGVGEFDEPTEGGAGAPVPGPSRYGDLVR